DRWLIIDLHALNHNRSPALHPRLMRYIVLIFGSKIQLSPDPGIRWHSPNRDGKEHPANRKFSPPGKIAKPFLSSQSRHRYHQLPFVESPGSNRISAGSKGRCKHEFLQYGAILFLKWIDILHISVLQIG